jgi:hypothetical protein
MKCSRCSKFKGKINNAVIENMMFWHHSGFNVYCGPTIWPHNYQDLKSLFENYLFRPISLLTEKI